VTTSSNESSSYRSFGGGPAMGGGAVRRWGRCPIRRRHEGCRRVRRVAEKEGGGRRSTTSCGGRNQIAYSRERVTGSALGRSFYELVYFPLMYFL
jgi:hypothetical protein